MDKHFENKQISKDDIVRMAKMLEAYKEEWQKKVEEEDKYVKENLPNAKEKFKYFSSEVQYNIEYKNGRDRKEDSYSWFCQNIETIDDIKYVEMRYRINFSDGTVDDKSCNINIYLQFYLYNKQDDFYQNQANNIVIDVRSEGLEMEADVIHKQLLSLKNEYKEEQELQSYDIIKFANIIESYKKEWEEKKSKEDEKLKEISPKLKKKYDMGRIVLDYSVRWLDGIEKQGTGYEWFEKNLKDIQTVQDVRFDFNLHFRDESAGEENSVYRSLNADIWVRSGKDDSNDASVSYRVDSSQMDEDADDLYKRIENVFSANDKRYDSTIKNRTFRIQSFSIAVGIIFSYILYIILKIVLNGSEDVFAELISNKYVIVFGQWIVAVVGGNVLASWYINMLYKPMLPQKKYVGYDSSNHKSIYKDKVEEYIADSEVQIGKFYDLKQRRQKIEKMLKISLIIIAIQLVISVILFLVLK